MLGLSIIFLYSRSSAFCLLIDGGTILLSTGNHSTGVEPTVPVINRIVLFNSTSTFFASALVNQDEQQYSAVEFTNPSADVLKQVALAAQDVLASLLIKLFLVLRLEQSLEVILL